MSGKKEPLRSKLMSSISGKQITRFYSGCDSHTYWTLVIDYYTTAKVARAIISDKLGDDTVSPSSFSIVLEADTSIVAIGDDDRLLEVKARFKKKRKKEGEVRFVLQGLDITNNNINSNYNNHNATNNGTDMISPPPSPVLNSATGPYHSQSASSSEDERPNGAKLKGKDNPAKIAVVSNSAKTKKHLTLIHVFYNNHIYWTLAIDATCTVDDVCKIIGEKLGTSDTCVSLHEVEMELDGGKASNNADIQENTANSTTGFSIFNGLSPSMSVRKLAEEALIQEIVQKWGKNSRSRFFVKEERLCTDDEKAKMKSKRGSTQGPILVCASEEVPESIDEPNSFARPGSSSFAPLRPGSSSFAPLRPGSNSFAPLRPGSSSFTPLRPGSSSFAPVTDEQRKNPINLWIRESDIKLVKKISSGAFAKVFKGIYKDIPVAIKVLKGSLTEENITNFKNEFAILSQVQSPNLVSFYGACIEKKLTMVMEYCPKGTLYHVMKDPNEEIGWKRVVDFFTQTVRGIDCLHNCMPPILHRDLKSLNILVSENWEVKVADFGLSRFNTLSNHSSLGRICGTMAYCAPEVYKGERFGVKSDIYSLGIILWELVVRCVSKQYKPPYSEYPFISFDFQIIIQTSQNGLRPTIPPQCPPVITTLIQRCWHPDPNSRPTCAEILTTLEALGGEIKEDSQPTVAM